MSKIYISGPITGLPLDVVEYNFSNAETMLSNKDNEISNPWKEIPYIKGKTWEEYMLEDIALLFKCDTIYMLKGWEESKGAKIERDIAYHKGYTILYQ